ncbi:MAG TPA: hypothetical protein VHD36_07660 [Pirellulales bacterium]|nr:hypothetical protein [Pirellulales bacterium]
MSNVERFQAEPPPPPSGMSTTAKVVLGCLAGLGVLCLLRCGSFVGLSWWGISKLKSSVLREPAQIQALAADVGTIDVPPGLHPEAGIDMRIPFVDRTFLKAVIYTDDRHSQILALAEFSENFTAVDENQLRDKIDQALHDSDEHEGDDDFRVEETHTVTLEIRGQPAEFRIDQGVDKHDHKLIRAFGRFDGQHGVGLLFLQLDGEQNSREQVEQILRSIH